jgi:hypothetical protein
MVGLTIGSREVPGDNSDKRRNDDDDDDDEDDNKINKFAT